MLFQIADSNFPAGTITIHTDTANTHDEAHAIVDVSGVVDIIGDLARDFFLYVKFKLGLKKEILLADEECMNHTTAEGADESLNPTTQPESDSATLRVDRP